MIAAEEFQRTIVILLWTSAALLLGGRDLRGLPHLVDAANNSSTLFEACHGAVHFRGSGKVPAQWDRSIPPS